MKMAAPVGNIGPFEENTEQWSSFTERFEYFALANKREGRGSLEGRGSAADPVSHLSVSSPVIFMFFVVLSDQARILFVAK